MTNILRRHVLPAAAAAGTLVALSTGAPAQAMTLPESGPTAIQPAGPTTTYSSQAYEEAIAACMADRGFEYEPYVYSVDVTTLEERPNGQQVIGMDMETFTGGGDPNERIVARLSTAERVAYHHALYGPDNPLDARGYPTGRSLGTSDDSCGGVAAE